MSSPKMPPAFKKKIGPLPLWGWLLASVGAYLAYRTYSGASNPAAGPGSLLAGTAAPPTADQSGSGGSLGDLTGSNVGGGFSSGSGGGSATDSGYSAYSDALAQLESQNANLQASLLQYSQGGYGGGTGDYSTSGDYGSGVASSGGSSGSPAVASKPTSANHPAVASIARASTPAASKNYAAAAQSKTAAAHKAGAPVAYGGVTQVQHLKNGSTVTVYASGRKVQQAPGKKAYVIHK